MKSRINYKKTVHVIGSSKMLGRLGLYALDARTYANESDVRNYLKSYFGGYPRHRILVRLEQFEHENDPNGAVKVFNMMVGTSVARVKKRPTTKTGRATSTRMKALTKEARRLRTEKPSISWQTAMKRAAKSVKKTKPKGDKK